MSKPLFELVVWISRTIIVVNSAIGNTLVAAASLFFNATNGLVNAIGVTLLQGIDRKRFEYHSALITQGGELSELALMAEATRVRDSALANKVWTYSNTVAMNKIAAALHIQCGWEQERVHAYLKEVIEAIPGVTYYGG
jgi:hypothetical protein